jgi:phosphoglycolate phosphatase-like HAD superfamily hydrolase
MDIICDIDGTIADLSHRRKWIAEKPKNWKKFFEEMAHDLPIQPVIRVITDLHKAGNFIIFCSGRPDVWEFLTREWLDNYFGHNLGRLSPLYMRKTKDYRPDDIVKFELLQKIRADGFNPSIAFDDRQRVVDMWRKNGIICAQVAEGNF